MKPSDRPKLEEQKPAVVRGTRLGPYEVADLVGAGGMGEVYRARDTRLGRDVAIKVLPEHVAHDSATLARFGREARAVAALSHPHIEALFDIGEADGTHYLVMELLEGETLATRLRRGALPETEALRIGREIAEALGAAHAHGIVHRDVKPANVMLTRSGVKLLDFGLARLQQASAPGSETAATMTRPETGVIAGTLPYMAPEQLEGREADARADIWALGCVLFEMVTGRRAFGGESLASLVAAIEKDEAPSVGAHRPGASPAVDRLVRRCLQKDPEERWQSARDLAQRLREIAEASPEAEAPRPTRKAPPLRVAAVAAAIVLALLLAAVAGRLWLPPQGRADRAPVVRAFIDLPADAALPRLPYFAPAPRTEVALSPDGTRLAWSGSPDGSPEKAALHLYSLESGEVKKIAGTEGASQPLFSPDGRWLAFLAQGKLRKIPAEGGLVVDVAEVRGLGWPMGGAWAADGRIFLGSALAGLFWVRAEGGSLQQLTTVDPRRETGHRQPFVLPGGRALLFTTRPHPYGVRAQVEALVLATGERKALVDDCADARYLPTGHVVCARQGTVVAVPFDLETLEPTGAVFPVIDGVLQALNTGTLGSDSGAAHLAVSASGDLVYAPGGAFEDPPAELLLVDESSRAEPLRGFDKPLYAAHGRFSPDGRWLAFAERARSGLLWLFDVERGTHLRLSQEGIGGFPVWSPDGSRLVVAWSRAGALNLWSVPTDGGGERTRLTESEFRDCPCSWSPDGRVLAFVRGAAQGWDVLLYRFEDRQVVPFMVTPAVEWFPEFSPDGRWLAYSSDESGRSEVHVTSFPDRKQTLVVSREGGSEPAWSRDGRRLFFRSLDGQQMLEVAVRPGETLALGQPRVLFPTPFATMGPSRGYDLHPDGRRFLFARVHQKAAPPPITRLHLVHNWFAELEGIAATGR